MSTDRTGLTQTVIESLRRANQVLGGYAPERWMTLGLTIGQLKSLFFIASEGKTNFKSLAEALGVTPSSVTGLVDRLVEQGLVSRQESSEDRRVLLLQVTAKGNRLLTDLRESTASRMSAILAHMTVEDLSGLLVSLNALIAAGEVHRDGYSGQRPI